MLSRLPARAAHEAADTAEADSAWTQGPDSDRLNAECAAAAWCGAWPPGAGQSWLLTRPWLSV